MANQRILIVHDDPDMVAALHLPLKSAGYDVLDASSSQEGLQKIQEFSPTLIILDAILETAPISKSRSHSAIQHPGRHTPLIGTSRSWC